MRGAWQRGNEYTGRQGKGNARHGNHKLLIVFPYYDRPSVVLYMKLGFFSLHVHVHVHMQKAVDDQHEGTGDHHEGKQRQVTLHAGRQ
jgi:hypothetical protein